MSALAFDFSGKVILITGGTAGIGLATAEAFAKCGANIAITGRREQKGAEAKNKLNALGANALYINADISKPADCERMVRETVAFFGRLDFAYNNAALESTNGIRKITEETLDDYAAMFDANVRSIFLSMKYEIPAILETAGTGCIVNCSSTNGDHAISPSGGTLYSATKHAVNGLTRGAALEFAAQGIRINAVAPALIETDMARRFIEQGVMSRELLISKHPVGRLGQPNDIAHAVLWLCSEYSAFVTGRIVNVDGGYTLGA